MASFLFHVTSSVHVKYLERSVFGHTINTRSFLLSSKGYAVRFQKPLDEESLGINSGKGAMTPQKQGYTNCCLGRNKLVVSKLWNSLELKQQPVNWELFDHSSLCLNTVGKVFMEDETEAHQDGVYPGFC